MLHKMYVGVCDKGEIVADLEREKPDDEVTFDGEVSGAKISAVSKSWTRGNTGDILINGENLSLNMRGLNLVVYDCAGGRAVDSVAYDS